jgi:uncharacterized protein (DUF433 family)
MYSLQEASRLIRVAPRLLSRWLFGSQCTNKSRSREDAGELCAPLWKTEISPNTLHGPVIGFHDLLQARFVMAIVEHGISLSVVRGCIEAARSVYGVNYPFTSLQFKTDGKAIFDEALRRARIGESMGNPGTRRKIFRVASRRIIRPSLYAGIEYDGSRASKWYPRSRREHIVLDSSRQFGQPIVEDTGTPTGILYASYLAEGENGGALQLTADIYDVPPRFVRAAISFEQGLRQRTSSLYRRHHGRESYALSNVPRRCGCSDDVLRVAVSR